MLRPPHQSSHRLQPGGVPERRIDGIHLLQNKQQPSPKPSTLSVQILNFYALPIAAHVYKLAPTTRTQAHARPFSHRSQITRRMASPLKGWMKNQKWLPSSGEQAPTLK